MPRKKLRRFAAIQDMPHVVEDSAELRGQWNTEHFQREAPLVLELACGKGDYAISLAQQDPSRNYIGMDKKGERIWRGGVTVEELELLHVSFLRGNIERIAEDFGEGEVDEIWITFPGPFPKKRQEPQRLTHEKFLAQYAHILKPGGIVHLKTDHTGLYEYSLETVSNAGYRIEEACDNIDLRRRDEWTPALNIVTDFEQRHRADNRTIHYLRWRT